MSADNVRVCARFRPTNKLERQQGASIIMSIENDSTVIIKRGNDKKKFNLDHFYPPESEQETVYEHSGKPLVSEILEGYNATMFAYGQTGSGKTWSMMGDPEDRRNQGLIPRMINAIFDEIDQADENLEFVVKVSYVELYREKLRDLLETRSTSLAIREHRSGGIYIEGVKQPYVVSSEEVLWHLEDGSHNRATSATRMNETSSRSHAVFVFRLIAENKVTHSKKMSKLMMVDLAGSEKVRKTQAQGRRLEEAKGINQSLSTLGRVIQGLTTGKGHIAYRDSKLTRLLSDSLGGNSKTCIIVTCSPCEYNVEETVSTLRFGVNCKKVKNKPKVNQERSIAEYKILLSNAKNREEELMTQIKMLECKVEALSNALRDKGGSVEDAMAEAEDEFRRLNEYEEEDTKDESDDYGGRDSDDSGRGSPREQSSRRRKRSKKSDIVFHSSSGKAAEEMLKEKVSALEEKYRKCKEERNRFKDDAEDYCLRLAEAERQVKELFAEKLAVMKQQKHAEETVKKMAGQIGEYRLYKTKLDFMANDHQIQMERKDQELERMKQEVEDLTTELKEAETKGDGRRGDERSHSRESWGMMDDRKSSSKSGRGERDVRIERRAKLIHEKERLSSELRDVKKENKRYKKQIEMSMQRERYNDALRKNWNNQLAQMEQAVLLANQIHNRDRQQFQLELEEHTQENIRLKKFLKVLTNRQKSSRGNVARPVRSVSSSRKMTRSRVRGKRQSINFSNNSNRMRETAGRLYETPGGDDAPRYSSRDRSSPREKSPHYSYSPREDDRYKDRETQRYRE